MIEKEYWEIEHLLGKWDMECRIGNMTQRFFAKDAIKGYSISKQMQYEGKWRALSGVSDAGRLQGS